MLAIFLFFCQLPLTYHFPWFHVSKNVRLFNLSWKGRLFSSLSQECSHCSFWLSKSAALKTHFNVWERLELKVVEDCAPWQPEFGNILYYPTLHGMSTLVNLTQGWSERPQQDLWIAKCLSFPLHMSSEFCLHETEGSEVIVCSL